MERNRDFTSPDALFVGAIEKANKTELTIDECHTILQVEGHLVKFKVDTGSQVNILPLSVYKGLNTKKDWFIHFPDHIHSLHLIHCFPVLLLVRD